MKLGRESCNDKEREKVVSKMPENNLLVLHWDTNFSWGDDRV